MPLPNGPTGSSWSSSSNSSSSSSWSSRVGARSGHPNDAVAAALEPSQAKGREFYDYEPVGDEHVVHLFACLTRALPGARPARPRAPEFVRQKGANNLAGRRTSALISSRRPGAAPARAPPPLDSTRLDSSRMAQKLMICASEPAAAEQTCCPPPGFSTRRRPPRSGQVSGASSRHARRRACLPIADCRAGALALGRKWFQIGQINELAAGRRLRGLRRHLASWPEQNDSVLSRQRRRCGRMAPRLTTNLRSLRARPDAFQLSQLGAPACVGQSKCADL